MVPIYKMKQIHFMRHQLTKELGDHLPFEVLEAGFDDNTYDVLYRPIYLQVKRATQHGLLLEKERSKPAKGIVPSITVQDYITKCNLEIEPEFLMPGAVKGKEGEAKKSKVKDDEEVVALEMLVAALNGF